MNRRTLGLAVLAGALAGCGGSTPTAAPTPPPAPTPQPTPSVVIDAGCNLPALPDLHNQCPVLAPQYSDIVDGAIKKVFTDHPELFDFTQTKGGGLYSYKVLDRRAYTGAVVTNIQSIGVCASDEKEEIAVKRTQQFNEQYNIWTSDGYVRMPPGAYITTCFPAQF